MQKGSTTRDAATGARTATGATEPRRSTRDRLVHEVVRFGLMFVYLWVVFGLFVLHERIIRGQMGLGFQAQGFALINALVLAKVMLVAEDLRLDRGVTRAAPGLCCGRRSGAVRDRLHRLPRPGTACGRPLARIDSR